MKKELKILGIIVILAIIGFSIMSCGNRCPQSRDGKHNWVADWMGEYSCSLCGVSRSKEKE